MKEFVVTRRSDPTGNKPRPPARFRIDDNGILTWADSNAENLFGYGGGRFRGLPMRKLVATTEDDPLSPGHDDSLSRGRKLTLTFRHEDGYFFTGELGLSTSHVDADHAARASITSMPDAPIDMRLLRQIEASAPIGLWELTVQGNSILWTEGVYRIFDLRPGLEVDPEHALFYFQEGQQRVRAAVRRCLQRGAPFSLELPIVTAQQRRRWVRLSGQAQRQDAHVRAVTGTLVDLTAEHDQAATVRHWQRLLSGLLATTTDLVVVVDPSVQILVLNQAFATQFEALFGVRPKVGDQLLALLPGFPNECRLYQRLWERAMERESFCVEMPLAQQNRDLPVFEIHYHRLTDDRGNLVGAAHIARDMSAQLGVGSSRNYLQSHDPLTGLLNRKEFLQRLQRDMGHNADRGTPCALLYLDLDHFETLNEKHGAGACDRYLRSLAQHLGTRVRQRDSLARIGGDKFAVLLDNCEEADTPKVARNLMAAIEAFVFEWEEAAFGARASAGLLPFTATTATTPDEVLALAADLCQTAKNAGRARLHMHQNGNHSGIEPDYRDRVEQLQTAIENGGITLRFQTIRPITSPTWGDHVEILSQLKLDNPESIWEPADFIPIAERFGLSSRFDYLVVAKTLAWLEQNPVMVARLKTCSFNLSLASILGTDFTVELKGLLAGSRFSPEVFCFEIKESDAARHPDAAGALCHDLHQVGCRVALDRVSGAAQSYTLISRLPLDIIKLDARLMKAMALDPVQQVMVEALRKMAEVAGITTVAQYIEDDQMLKQARELGIDFGQGFQLAPPKPLTELAPPRRQPRPSSQALTGTDGPEG